MIGVLIQCKTVGCTNPNMQIMLIGDAAEACDSCDNDMDFIGPVVGDGKTWTRMDTKESFIVELT